jgi:hypothetical protein
LSYITTQKEQRMNDLIYAGIKIDETKPDGILLQAMNTMYNAANNAFAMLVRMPEEEINKVRTELKVPEAYTMQAIADSKDSAYNALHFKLIQPFINDLNATQKQYMYAMSTFFNEVYCITYMRSNSTVESKARVDKAYATLKYSLEHADLIFTESLMGKNMKNERMLAFLKQQLNDIVSAKKMTEKMVEKQPVESATEETNDSTDVNPAT